MIYKSHKISWDELLTRAYVWALNDIKMFFSLFGELYFPGYICIQQQIEILHNCYVP